MPTLPKSAWNRGESLSGSLEIYTSDELWHEIEPLHEKFTEIIPADLPQEPIQRGSQPLLTVSPTADYQKYLALYERLKSEITGFLKSGKLLGVGFLKPRRRGVEPIWIPAECWNASARISWDDSELWMNERVFADVRIVRPQISTRITYDSNTKGIRLTAAPGRNRSGRPTRATEIKAAYDELKSEEGIDLGSSLRANLPKIQARVQRRAASTSTKGLEYNAVRKAVGADFQRDKERKTSSISSR